MSGKIIGDAPCPQCRERGRDSQGNHLMLFEDGGAYCNRCEYYQRPDGMEIEEIELSFNPEELSAGPLPTRSIDQIYVDLYGGRVEHSETNGLPVAVWFPRHKGGQITGWKRIGLLEKTFRAIGDGKECDLFGMHLDGGRKLCIITEGELDCLATKQILASFGKDYRVVSLPNGANATLNEESSKWLSTFETIIVATDNDEPGNEAASRLAEMFEPGKCKRAILPCKDANECLVQDKGKEFYSALMSARVVTADGVILGSDTWDAVITSHHNKDSAGIPFPWPDLNAMAYGSRIGELDVWTSGTGMGKSAAMRELIHHWSIVHHQKVGVLALEEDLTTTIIGQMSICANLPLHLPEVKKGVSDEDLREYWEMANDGDNLVCVDHWGSVEESRLMQKLRYLASGMGCKYIVLDHLSILVSETATDGDERKNIDVLMTKLKRLTEELQVHISLVSHLRKASGVPFEEGATPSLDDLRGSGSIKQLPHGIYALSRNQQDHDPVRRNTTKLTVLKNRFCGRTGDAGLLQYNSETGRLGESILSLDDYRNGVSVSPLSQRAV